MSSFFERHKGKSVWALLLLLLFRTRVLLPLLLAVMIGSFIFGSAGLGESIPWLSRFTRAIETSLGAGSINSGGTLARLGRILRHEDAEGRSWGLGSGRGVEASYQQNKSSIDMVRGVDLTGNSAMQLPNVVQNARTVSGILSPEESKKYAPGVPLDPRELLAGLVRNANAEEIPGASAGANNAAVLLHGRAISPDEAVIPESLRGFGAGAASGRGGSISGIGAGGGRGRLSSFSYNKLGYSISGATQVPAFAGNTTPMYNLAEAQAYSCIAAPPDNVCPTNNDCAIGLCPGEFASYTGGAPFVGAPGGGLGILTLNTDPTPLTPNAQGALQGNYAGSQQQQQCASQVSASNQQFTTQLSATFMQCCQSVNTQLSNCKSSCPPFPFSIFMGCKTSCVNNANNNWAQNCVNVYVSGYNNMAAAEDGACNGAVIAPTPIAGVSATQWAQCNGGNLYN